MQAKIQIVSILVTGGLFFVVFEFVRRKRLQERYALLWLFATGFMLGLAVWRDALTVLADAVGIAYPPSALFAIAFAFILVLLLHFSLVISRLADQTKVLAQEVGILRTRLEEIDAAEQTSDLRPATPATRA